MKTNTALIQSVYVAVVVKTPHILELQMEHYLLIIISDTVPVVEVGLPLNIQ